MRTAVRAFTAAATLLAAVTGAAAQSDDGTRGNKSMAGKATSGASKLSPEKEKDIRQRGADYYAACMKDWEPATHMTKQEWTRTCRSVADERVKFLLEQAE